MSQGRDEAGRFVQAVSEQDILKVFDYEDDPVLTTAEVANGLKRFGIEITSEGVRNRLEQMTELDLVSRKKFGARAVGWWAEVAPSLGDETADRIESRSEADEWTEL